MRRCSVVQFPNALSPQRQKKKKKKTRAYTGFVLRVAQFADGQPVILSQTPTPALYIVRQTFASVMKRAGQEMKKKKCKPDEESFQLANQLLRPNHFPFKRSSVGVYSVVRPPAKGASHTRLPWRQKKSGQ